LIKVLSKIPNNINTADTNTPKIETIYTNRIGISTGSENNALCWSGEAGSVAGMTTSVATLALVEDCEKI